MRNIIIVSHDGELFNFERMAGIRVVDWKQEFALMAVYEHWEAGYLLFHDKEPYCRALLRAILDRITHEGDTDYPLVIDLKDEMERILDEGFATIRKEE